MDCISNHVIYLISCNVCEMQYVKSTITKFRIRFNNQKSRLKNQKKLDADKMKNDCIYKHFNQADHQGLKPWLHVRFFACTGDAIFLKIVASPAHGKKLHM